LVGAGGAKSRISVSSGQAANLSMRLRIILLNNFGASQLAKPHAIQGGMYESPLRVD
jgi:hypothetical protein